MCDINKSKTIIKKNTILYSGNTGKRLPTTLDNVFKYIGQLGQKEIRGNFVSFYSTDYDTARGYALSCQNNGYIHKFRLSKDIEIYEQDVFLEASEIAECVCDQVKGIGIFYSDIKDEYGLCDAEDYLEYIETQKCPSMEWYNVLTDLKTYDIIF